MVWKSVFAPVVASTIAASLAFACSGDEVAPATLAQGCSVNTDCNAPLVCAFGRCHEQCTSTRDCSGEAQCVRVAQSGVCQLSDEADCTKDSDCVAGQLCVSGACSVGCRDDSGCAKDQECIAGVCRDRALADAGVDAPGHTEAAPPPEVGPPPACSPFSLDADCPSNECRRAVACSALGACVYESLHPRTCGLCDLGQPSCADPSAPACTDIEILGVSSAEIECDSTATASTFVFVDTTYTGPKMNGSREAPFRTFDDAMAAASKPGRAPTTIIVAGSPVFTSPLVLKDGVAVRGGYTATDDAGKFTGQWRRDLSRRPTWSVGPEHVSGGELVGMRAEHLKRATIVADLTIRTTSITGVSSAEGASNVGALAIDAPGLRLFGVTIEAGDAQAGAAGAVGAVGANATNIEGTAGKETTPGGTAPALSPGVAGGRNSLCDAPESQGGDGGDTGADSTHPGHDSPSGAKGDVDPGGTGEDGASHTVVAAIGSEGFTGATVDATGAITLSGRGKIGATGAPGRGGGGGFSDFYKEPGVTIWFLAWGGGGGAGGCGGAGGWGGYPGGYSIGFLIVDSPGIVVRGGSIASGRAGDGGIGGDGGAGAPGGSGGNGVVDANCCGPPRVTSTAGGKGSAGQQGGQGGPGAGGSSYAMYCSVTSPVIDGTAPTLLPGTAALGGTGAESSAMLGCTLSSP